MNRQTFQEPKAGISETGSRHDETVSTEEMNITPASAAAIPSTSQLSRLNFPSKLHRILSTAQYNDIVCWLPHGRSWRVLQQNRFEKEVLPVFFRHGRYASFARQINGWGFRRIATGPDFNSYYHELFLRDSPDLCLQMTRPSSAELADRKKEEPDSPPNFYGMPPLEESANNDSEGRPTMDETQRATRQNEYISNLFQRISLAPPHLQMRILQVELSMLERRRNAVLEQLQLLFYRRTAGGMNIMLGALDAGRIQIPTLPHFQPLQPTAPINHHLGAAVFPQSIMGTSLAQRAALELYLRNHVEFGNTSISNDARDISEAGDESS